MTLDEALDKATVCNLSTAKDKKEIIDKLMSTRSTLVPKVKLTNIIGVLLKDITKLEKQIISMRNCENCKNQSEDYWGNACCHKDKSAWDCDCWEMKE